MLIITVFGEAREYDSGSEDETDMSVRSGTGNMASDNEDETDIRLILKSVVILTASPKSLTMSLNINKG